ncbi:MAG: hypothetical protein HY870_11150 [Chloroflexi bacterium]|nr:hypothetical protein [Chloroflexota bacterium]
MKRFVSRDGVIALVLCALVLGGYLLSGNTATYDSALSLHTAMSLVREGNTDLDEYGDIVRTTWLSTEEIDGHIYMLYPVGASVLAAPIVWIIDRVAPEFDASLHNGFGEPVQTAIGSLVMALTVTLMYAGARLYVARRYALWLALSLAFGTSAWSVVSRTLWQHGPSMLMLTLALYLVLRARTRPALIQLVSLPLAFAYVVRPTNSIAVAVFSLYVLIVYRRYFVRYVLWALPVAVPFILLNISVYHALLPNYYRWYSGFSLNTFLTALAGHLISPSRGLLIYSPFLIWSIAGVILKVRRREFECHDGAVLSVMLLHWVSISLWWNWWGGVSYGPRLFSDMLPYFVYWQIPSTGALARASGVRRRRLVALWAVLLACSVAIHARGVTSAEGLEWNAAPAPIDFYSFRVWDWRDVQWLRGLHWGTPVDVAVSGVLPQYLVDPDLAARLGTNDVRLRPFDAEWGVIVPPGVAWFAIAETQLPPPELATLFDGVTPIMTGHTLADNPPYRLYHIDLSKRVQAAALRAAGGDQPIGFGQTAELLGVDLTIDQNRLSVISYWRALERSTTPLRVFVHALGADDSIVTQDDRLDAPATEWRAGDWIVQVHRLQFADETAAHTSPITLGVYDPDSGQRLSINSNGQNAESISLR